MIRREFLKFANMSETKRIAKLFSAWYDGNPWTAIKMTDLLKDINHEQAARRVIPNANTIWQLVQHCLGWRENVLRKIQGEEFKSAEDNYLKNPDDVSPQAWDNLKKRYAENENKWQEFLNGLPDAFLLEGYKPSKDEWTVYEVIHGLLHHDNYHFGQISMLKKLL